MVEGDFRDAHVTKNYYAPHVFRMVVEVTSSNWSDDLGPKVECYAQAGIPAYLVADRKHGEVLLYTDPADGKYPDPRRFERGVRVPVPKCVGVDLELSVDVLLDGDADPRSAGAPGRYGPGRDSAVRSFGVSRSSTYRFISHARVSIASTVSRKVP